MENYWMFICRPSTWDAVKFFKEGQTAGVWKANKKRVNPGDKGVLRVSNPDSALTSIYAMAEVISRPDFLNELNQELVAATDRYWSSEAKAEMKGDELFIELRYTAIFVNRPILLSEIAAAGGTDKDLFEGRQASCFKLKDRIFWSIEKLAKTR